MDFKQLRSFIAVIRYGSFTTAAAKLRISQPTVSTHIRQLEEELGTPLVLRNAKRVELTASGYKMFDQAVSMLAMHDKMLQSMRHHESDAIYVGASSIPSGYILPGLLAAFRAEQPDARFVITQDSSQTVLNGMLSGLYEIGFVGMPAKEDTLECVPFCRDKIVIATPNNSHFRDVDRSSRSSIEHMLRTEHVIMRKSGSGTRAMGNLILEGLGMEESDLNVFAHLNDQEATRNLGRVRIRHLHDVRARDTQPRGWGLDAGVRRSRGGCLAPLLHPASEERPAQLSRREVLQFRRTMGRAEPLR